MPRSQTPRSFLRGLFLLAALVTVITRTHTYGSPPGEERDIAMYAVTGHELFFEGRRFYSDLFEHKPPGIYPLFALGEALFGYTPRSILFVSLLFAVLGLVAVYYAASAASEGWRAGAWAMLLWALISGDVLLEGNQPNAELFNNVFLIFAFGIFLRLPENRLAVRRCLALGLAVTGAVVIKHFLVMLLPVLFAARGLRYRRDLRALGRLGLQLAIACVPVLVVCLAIVGYYVVTGRGAALYEAVIAFNGYYAGSLPVNALRSFEPQHLFALAHKKGPIPVLPLQLFTIGTAVFLLRRQSVPVLGDWMGYVLFTILAAGLPGRFYEHYQQYWLPTLAVGGGIVLAKLGLPARRWGIAVVILTAAIELSYYVSLRPPGLKPSPTPGWVERTGRSLRTRLRPGERFFAWADEPGLFFYSQHGPVGRHLWCDKLDRGPFPEKFRREAMAAIERAEPRLVVVDVGDGCPLSAFPALETLLEKKYAAESPNPRFRLYWKRK